MYVTPAFFLVLSLRSSSSLSCIPSSSFASYQRQLELRSIFTAEFLSGGQEGRKWWMGEGGGEVSWGQHAWIGTKQSFKFVWCVWKIVTWKFPSWKEGSMHCNGYCRRVCRRGSVCVCVIVCVYCRMCVDCSLCVYLVVCVVSYGAVAANNELLKGSICPSSSLSLCHCQLFADWCISHSTTTTSSSSCCLCLTKVPSKPLRLPPLPTIPFKGNQLQCRQKILHNYNK